MKILQITPSFAKFDAVGNDVELMHKCLQQLVPCYIYTPSVHNDNVETIDLQRAEQLASDPENLIIYHHCIAWPFIEDFLQNCLAKVVFKYHNITPPEFFKDYNPDIAQQCQDGREQTQRLAEIYCNELWMCDSRYNAMDIVENVPDKNIEILAPFNKLQEWGEQEPDKKLLDTFVANNATNLLFVGRVAPNKGHIRLLQALRCYLDNYDANAVLWIVGSKIDAIPDYNQSIDAYIARYGLTDNVKFAGQINDNVLIAYYEGCDMFLCASEHEGYCVPIVEAQYFGLPLIAMDAGAVGETQGNKQVLIKGSPQEFAAAIDVVAGNDEYRQYLQKKGRENFNTRFTQGVLGKRLVDILKRHILI